MESKIIYSRYYVCMPVCPFIRRLSKLASGAGGWGMVHVLFRGLSNWIRAQSVVGSFDQTQNDSHKH